MGIVQMAFVFIVKDIVGLLDGLEFDVRVFSFVLGDFVGVACKSSLGGFSKRDRSPMGVDACPYLPIRLPDIVFGCALVDS